MLTPDAGVCPCLASAHRGDHHWISPSPEPCMPDTADAPGAELFPALTAEQAERLARQGTKRRASAGEILAEPGGHESRLFLVVAGELEILGGSGSKVITRLGPGRFSGEASLLLGRP